MTYRETLKQFDAATSERERAYAAARALETMMQTCCPRRVPQCIMNEYASHNEAYIQAAARHDALAEIVYSGGR